MGRQPSASGSLLGTWRRDEVAGLPAAAVRVRGQRISRTAESTTPSARPNFTGGAPGRSPNRSPVWALPTPGRRCAGTTTCHAAAASVRSTARRFARELSNSSCAKSWERVSYIDRVGRRGLCVRGRGRRRLRTDCPRRAHPARRRLRQWTRGSFGSGEGPFFASYLPEIGRPPSALPAPALPGGRNSMTPAPAQLSSAGAPGIIPGTGVFTRDTS